MPKGLAFLNVKGWHTKSAPNREKLRLADAEAKSNIQKDRDRAIEKKKEQEVRDC